MMRSLMATCIIEDPKCLIRVRSVPRCIDVMLVGSENYVGGFCTLPFFSLFRLLNLSTGEVGHWHALLSGVLGQWSYYWA